jgi:ADP-ribosylglycohydrolase
LWLKGVGLAIELLEARIFVVRRTTWVYCPPMSTERPRVDARLLGGVWGHLVGDAMGVPYEFGPPLPPSQIRWGHQAAHRLQPPGTWSDDGGLMLAFLDSLLEVGFDTNDQARRALDWWLGGRYRPGRLFDIGQITSESLERFRSGTPAEQAGATGERDNGNGSLMRVLPLALVNHVATDTELIDMAMRASSVTHGHPRCKVTCAVYVLVAQRLLRGQHDRAAALDDAFQAAAQLLTGQEAAELRFLREFPARTGSGYVVDCFWSAWDAFAAADSYREAVELAIAYGDDTDTTACVAGGMAGIYWGVRNIPSDWLSGMRGHDIVDPLTSTLLSRFEDARGESADE